jgi:hypothetical protein
MNYCRACNQDFSSLEIFDRHRVGSHEHNWSLEHPDGRRCLSAGEMQDLGWRLNELGRWLDPIRSARASRLLKKAA